MKYTVFDGELVSLPWAAVLTAMRKDGVLFNVNEGHRTLARQTWFYQCMLSKRCNNGNLAAFPSPNAPHIRSGRVDHAVDFSNPEQVMTWLTTHGMHPTRPAGTGSRWEPWHIEVPASDLRSAAKRLARDEFDVLPKHVEHAVRKLIHHRHQAIDQAKTGKGPKYRRAVKWRNWWRRRVEGMYRRSRKPSTRRLLNKVLDVN